MQLRDLLPPLDELVLYPSTDSSACDPPPPPPPPINYLQRLPVELWDQILRFCWNSPHDRRSLKSLPLVCPLFRDILDSLRYTTLTLWHRRFPNDSIGGSGYPPGATAVRIVVLFESRPERFAHVRSLNFFGPETAESLLKSPRTAQSLETRLLFGLLILKTPEHAFKLPNVTSLLMSNCVLDVALIGAMRNLPNLKIVEFTSVSLKELGSLEVTNFGISDLRLSQVHSSDDELSKLAMSFGSPHMKSLSLTRQSVPRGFLLAVSLSVSPGSIEKLTIEDAYVEPSELIEFFESHPAIRHLSYNGRFSFRSLPASALPKLERCDASDKDIEWLVRGRPLRDVTLRFFNSASTSTSSDLSALALSTKPIRRLKLEILRFEAALLDSIITNCKDLEDLDIVSTDGVGNGLIAGMMLKFRVLYSLKSLSFVIAAPGIGTWTPPELDFFYKPEGQVELLRQQARVKKLETRCWNLRLVHMRPVSWVWLSTGAWRPYPYTDRTWDMPLPLPSEGRRMIMDARAAS